MLVGYARVSTNAQDTDMQLRALRRAGVKTIYHEKTSSVGQRPELQRLLSHIAPGHRLVVYKLDRVARSLKDLLLILERLEASGAGFQSLTEPIDTATPAGRLMLQMLGAVAEFERSLIRQRTISGQVAAIKRGVQWGRPKLLTEKQESEVWSLYLLGHNQAEISRYFRVSLIVIRRIIDENLGKPRKPRFPVLGQYL